MESVERYQSADVVRPLHDLAGCPRCRAPLAMRRVAEREIVECSSCGGIWLAPDVFEGMCAKSEQAGTLSRMIGAQTPPTKPVDDTRVTYLKCPTCAEFMFRKNLGPGSGLILDVCKDHGVWFDHDELVRALEFAAKGGLDRVREREKRRIESERTKRNELAGKLPVEDREFDWTPTPTFEDTVISTIGTLAKMLFGRAR